jgi:hypothetical protein
MNGVPGAILRRSGLSDKPSGRVEFLQNQTGPLPPIERLDRMHLDNKPTAFAVGARIDRIAPRAKADLQRIPSPA